MEQCYQNISLENRVKGCMFGLAIGDALGAPTEFLRLNEIYQIFGQDGVADFAPQNLCKRVMSHYFPPRGSYTDDTQQSLAVAKALIKSKSDEIEEIMDNIKEEYIAWLESMEQDPKNIRAPGETSITGIQNLKRGIHWKESGIKNSRSCGASMRTAPIGIRFYNDFKKLTEVAYAASVCTHANPNASAAGVGTAYLTGLAMNHVSPTKMIEELEKIGLRFDVDFSAKIKQVKEVLCLKDSHTAMKKLGEGWDGDEAVALGLYCFLKNPGNYSKTVLMAANTNGDSDSIACIAGAISGAYNGINAIPDKWIREIENSEFLSKISSQLYEKIKSD